MWLFVFWAKRASIAATWAAGLAKIRAFKISALPSSGATGAATLLAPAPAVVPALVAGILPAGTTVLNSLLLSILASRAVNNTLSFSIRSSNSASIAVAAMSSMAKNSAIFALPALTASLSR